MIEDDQHASKDREVCPILLTNVCSALGAADPLPQIPVMCSTRLQFELLLQDGSIDLGALSEVILSDAGATLQIFRVIGEEYDNIQDRPTRMGDCIASLDVARCYAAICASEMLYTGPMMEEWQHCRHIAECVREVATCIDGVSPEEAYLVGLLYRLGKLPHLLGWDKSVGTLSEDRALGVMLADHWHLPGYLQSAVREQQQPNDSTQWAEILEVANKLAEQMRDGLTLRPE